MDFTHADRADAQKLNVILWKDAMGDKPVPAQLLEKQKKTRRRMTMTIGGMADGDGYGREIFGAMTKDLGPFRLAPWFSRAAVGKARSAAVV